MNSQKKQNSKKKKKLTLRKYLVNWWNDEEFEKALIHAQKLADVLSISAELESERASPY